MMSKRLVIIDSAFSQGEGHHLAANELLAGAAYGAGYDQVRLICQKNSPLSTLADGRTETLRLLQSTPYQPFRVGDLPRLAELNRAALDDFRSIPDEVFEPGDQLLIHTVNEVQFLGLTTWLAELMGRISDLRVRLALMFPAGLDFNADGVFGVRDPVGALIMQHGAAVLKPFGDRVEWMGIGRSIADEFALLTGETVSYAPALVPNIGKPLQPKPDVDVPNIVLYMGDAKFDKGFHHLPAIITHLRRTSRDFNATIQVSGAVIQHYPDTERALTDAARNDPRFHIRNGRLSSEDYETVWQQGHVALLGYDPGVYRYKSSGLCWEAMNYAVPAVVLRDSFHHREITSYGFDPVVVDEYWPDTLFAGLETALDACVQMAPAWQDARQNFVDLNRPELYLEDDLQGHKGSRVPLDLAPLIPAWRQRAFEALFGEKT
jgi:hypothetical protein